MGKQITFYIEKELEDEFIAYVFEKGFVMLHSDLEEKEILTYNESLQINEKAYILYLYKKDLGEIVTDKNCEYRLDCTRSPLLEFTRTLVKQDKKVIVRGRLWAELKYYDKNGDIIFKNSQLEKEFDILAKWLKKRIPFQEVKKGEYIVKEYITDNIKEATNRGFRLM